MPINVLFKLLCLTLCLAATHAAWAQSLYQVELLVFERKGLARTLGASLDEQTVLSYPENAQLLTSDPAGSGLLSLPDSAPSLASQAAALNASKQTRVLLHQTWLQPIGDRVTAVAVTGGNRFGAHQELEGYVSFNNTKSLEIDAHLWLAQFMPDNGQPIANSPQLPSPPSQITPQNTAGFITTLIVPMQRQQRVKLGEIYYLDHPVLGALVKVQLANNP